MHIEKRTLKNIFIGVSACIVLYWLLHATESVKSFFAAIYGILSPFLLGAGIAFILNVPMRAIEHRLVKISNEKVRRVLALTITCFLAILVLTLVVCLLIPQLTETFKNLMPTLKGLINSVEGKLSTLMKDNPSLKNWLNFSGDNKLIDLGGFAQQAITAIGSITGALMNVFVSLVFAIYCLCQKETLARQGRKIIYAYLPERFCDRTIEILQLTNTTFSNFLAGQCIEVCILGALFAIVMWILGMPYIPLISVLVAVTAFIPVVGAWIGCISGAFLIFLINPFQAVTFVVMSVVLQQFENNVIYPRVVGTSIGLSGMWVLVAVGVGGGLMGVAGMFLMIPIAAVIQNLLRESINNKLEEKDIDPKKLQPSRRKFRRRLNLKKTPERKHQNPLKVSSDDKEE